MIPITFFVLSWSVGTSLEASAADSTPIDPSIARAMAMRCSEIRYFSARFDRSVFARTRTRKNATMRASRFSLRSRWPRSAVLRVRRSWSNCDRVGLYSARTILRTHLRRLAVLRVVLLEGLPVDFCEPRLVDRREEPPADLEGRFDRPVLLGPLADELLLEPVRELEHLPVPLGKRFFPDDRYEAADVLAFRVRRVELVRDLLVVLPRAAFPDPRVHESGQGRQRVDRRIDAFSVEVAVQRDLAFRDVASQVGNRMGPIGIGNRHDRDLRDGPGPAMGASRALVDCREVRVRVAGISAPAWHFLARGADLPQRLRVVRHVRQDREDVHAHLVREALRCGEGHPRRDEQLDREVVRAVQEEVRPLKRARPFEVVHEDAGLLVGDPHRREHDAERLLGPEDLRLAPDLQADSILRQASAGEEWQRLAANEGVEAVDGRDAGPDELRGLFAGVRVDRGSLNLHAFLRDDRRSAVRGFPGSGEDAAEHLAGHTELG